MFDGWSACDTLSIYKCPDLLLLDTLFIYPNLLLGKLLWSQHQVCNPMLVHPSLRLAHDYNPFHSAPYGALDGVPMSPVDFEKCQCRVSLSLI